MLKSFRTEIHPTEEQKVRIHKTIGTSRFIYNFYLAHNKEPVSYTHLLLSGQNYHVVQDRRIVSAGSRDRTGIQRLDRGPSDELRDRSADADHLRCSLHHH